MQKIIIGIHGLGNHPPRRLLKRWWKQAIREGLQARGTPVRFFRFELAYWADIVHPRPLNPKVADPSNPLFLEEPYMPGVEFRRGGATLIKQKLRDVVGKRINRAMLKKDMSLKLAGVADFVLHRYFGDLRAYFAAPGAVRNAVRGALEQIIRKHRGKEILLIGHSMGSIIAYDVLIRPGAGWSVDTLITIGSPLGLPVVVSKLHSELKKNEDGSSVPLGNTGPTVQLGRTGSTVQLRNAEPPVLPVTSFPPGSSVQLGNTGPTTLRTPSGVRTAWINMADLADKVAIDFKLADNYGKNDAGVGVTDLIVHNNYECGGRRNPHKSYGYLRAPETSDIIYEFLNRRECGFWGRVGKMISLKKSEIKKQNAK